VFWLRTSRRHVSRHPGLMSHEIPDNRQTAVVAVVGAAEHPRLSRRELETARARRHPRQHQSRPSWPPPASRRRPTPHHRRWHSPMRCRRSLKRSLRVLSLDRPRRPDSGPRVSDVRRGHRRSPTPRPNPRSETTLHPSPRPPPTLGSRPAKRKGPNPQIVGSALHDVLRHHTAPATDAPATDRTGMTCGFTRRLSDRRVLKLAGQ
jgi:hypothetical protein